MWVDVLKLREWYRTLQGRVVRRTLCPDIQELCSLGAQQSLLGVGYCQPYFPEAKNGQTIVLAGPAQMGVTLWPEGGKQRATLVDETALPFSENTFDVILLCHCLEMTGDAQALLESCWHSLRPDGRLVIMVPNRAGAWARRDDTTFAHGQPYSPGQVARLLRKTNFTVSQADYALYIPPLNWRWVFRLHALFEKIGRRWQAPVGGVLLVQAKKDIFGMKAIRPVGRKVPPLVHVPAAVLRRMRLKNS